LCAYFIDWQKAFDCANWTKLTQIIKATVIKWREKRLISKLYMDQSVLLQRMIERLKEIGRCYRMEMKVKKTQVM
jgi:hypothetical protein